MLDNEKEATFCEASQNQEEPVHGFRRSRPEVLRAFRNRINMGATPSKRSKKKQLAKHNVYDATSRSVNFDLPPSLNDPTKTDMNPPTQRHPFGKPSKRCFLLSDFLSSDECQFLMQKSEEAGYLEHSDLKAEYPESYRNNQRLIYLSKILASTLWKRLLPHLTEEDIKNVTPYGYGTEGIWIPRGLNDGNQFFFLSFFFFLGFS